MRHAARDSGWKTLLSGAARHVQSFGGEVYSETPDPIPPKARYIGSGTQGSEVITGVLLHQTRYPAQSECAFRFAKLEVACALDAAAAEAAQNLQRTALDPYGQDPVFNPLNELYDPSVDGKVGDFYNATSGAGEVANTGFPYAFYHRPVRGAEPGFPVVFQVRGSRGLGCADTCLLGHR